MNVVEKGHPSLADLWDIVQQQRSEIEVLKAKNGNGRVPSRSSGASNDSSRVSRAGLLKAAALGVAGVAGAGVLMHEQSGIAGATGAEGPTQFSGTTASNIVTITNSGTGPGLTTTSSSTLPAGSFTNNSSSAPGTAIRGISAHGVAGYFTTGSTANGAYGLEGYISTPNSGSYSSGVGGFNQSTGTTGIGVYGYQYGTGWGVYGSTAAGTGVYGSSPTGTGVYGQTNSTAAGAVGVQGVSLRPNAGSFSSGVWGVNNGTGGSGIGVYGTHSGSGYGVYGSGGIGVYGTGTYGVYGSASYLGVYGNGTSYGTYGYSSSGTGVTGYGGAQGVYGYTSSTASFASAVAGVIGTATPGGFSSGVWGANDSTTGNGIGVYGTHNGTGYGGYFRSGYIGTYGSGTSYGHYGSGGSIGVYGTGGSYGVEGNSGYLGVYGTGGTYGVYGTGGTYGVYGYDSSGTHYGVYGYSSSLRGVQGYGGQIGARGDSPYVGAWGQGGTYGLVGESNVTSGTGYGIYASCASGYAGYFAGNVHATAYVSTIPGGAGGKSRTVYGMQSPENWLEDFGSATLRNGKATVKIDRKFSALVNTDDYHVFLTPKGNSKGLYISATSATSFTVREQESGKSNLKFSYRIVALRADVKAPRLKLVKTAQHPSIQKIASLPKLKAAPAMATPAVVDSKRLRSVIAKKQRAAEAISKRPSPVGSGESGNAPEPRLLPMVPAPTKKEIVH